MSGKEEIMDTPPTDLGPKLAEKKKQEARDAHKKEREKVETFKKRMEGLMAREISTLSKTELTELLGWQIRLCREGVDQRLMQVGIELEQMKDKQVSTYNMMQSFLQFQGAFDAKVDAVIDIVKEKFDVSDREFEDRTDKKMGLVRRTDGVIEDGDVVYVDYSAEIVGEEGKNFPGRVAENWPVRVGSGSFYGEDVLKGKPCEEGLKFKFEQQIEKSYSNKSVAGKLVSFDLEILKIKASTKVLENRAKKKAKETENDEGKGTGAGP